MSTHRRQKRIGPLTREVIAANIGLFDLIASAYSAAGDYDSAAKIFKELCALAPSLPLLTALSERVAELPRIAAYLKSPRRLPFNQEGIFRRYPELDLQAARTRAKSAAPAVFREPAVKKPAAKSGAKPRTPKPAAKRAPSVRKKAAKK